MCLGIPGKIVRWVERDGPFATAEVEFGGVCRKCQMAFVTEASEGDYVIVHAGVAISSIDSEEAIRALAELASLSDEDDDHLDGWKDGPR